MFKFISKHILTGLVTILPVVLTAYLLYWFAISMETMLGNLIRIWLPEDLYWPGMGLIAGLVVMFIVGLLMHAYVVQVLFAMGEKILYHTPVIKSIYSALRDFLNYFSPAKKKEFDQVVAVTLGDSGMQVIGFVTVENPKNLPERFSPRRQCPRLPALELHDRRLCRTGAAQRDPTGRHEHGRGDALHPDRRRHRRHQPRENGINQQPGP